jgi:transcriptional regulator with XRE-family HTH domain
MKEDAITPSQIRAARNLLGWSQADLAGKAGVATSTVADFERGSRIPVQNNTAAMAFACERAGLIFLNGGVSPGFRWTVFTESSMSILDVTFAPDNLTVVRELASIFGEASDAQVAINPQQCVTAKMKSNLVEFAKLHGEKVPHVNRLKKTVCDLPDGTFFLLLPITPQTTKQKLDYERYLHGLNHPEEATLEAEFDQLFRQLVLKYDSTQPRTSRRTDIGHPRKKDRICRFCHRTLATGATFKKVAHAISAALGNQHLKLFDECDECNSHFGNNVEPTLITLLSIQRVFLDIRNHGERQTINLSGDKMFRTDERLVVSSSRVSTDDTGVVTAQLGPEQSIVPMRFYQALAKFALSVIPESELPSLKRTVAWVREDKYSGTRLPDVVSTVVGLPPDPSAQITVYVRRDDDDTLPHVVCEFRLGCYIYVYVLPFSDKDHRNLAGFFDAEAF